MLRRRSHARALPVGPITANVSIGVAALSYAGRFNIIVVADRELCADLAVFVEGVERALDSLGDSVRAGA